MKYVDTNPRYSGIRSLVDQIPDKKAAKIQQYILKYADDYKKGGLDVVA
ncbi:hypothetical protein H1Z61_04185 [Bacillus aquiflavi]|uniref:Uncharacterized protein n=1 Tax=Bacillus aquiflavi TaxID=2672567 RepID=A0A6B3VU32_9BACI|nr:hypothetical protein [Bacillus aquiflavi]MBA4536360.1 hypothetical protein [Bacillus aquiflavi]NEY80728.1 hypothetical protein [Bacillus aquiflavi]